MLPSKAESQTSIYGIQPALVAIVFYALWDLKDIPDKQYVGWQTHPNTGIFIYPII